jgi:hypothetical protein
MMFGIEKCTTYKVTCGDVDLTHITVENNGGPMYSVYSNGEEIDVFNYRGDKPFDAIHDYLERYAIDNNFA